MRKSYKQKSRSCPLCKPHKTGNQNRWKHLDEAKLREDENEIREFNIEWEKFTNEFSTE